jgi:hypothetical protein
MDINPREMVELTEAELDAPLYEFEETVYIDYAKANAVYQDLVLKHKDLGAKLAHDKRRLALALVQALREAGRPATGWELGLIRDAGISPLEMAGVQVDLGRGDACEGRR